MANNLESQIHLISTRAAAEIAQAVRANIAAEVNRIIGSVSAAAAPKRGPGRPAKAAAPAAPKRKPGRPPAAAGAPATKAAPKKRGQRGVDSNTVERVVSLIGQKPGLRSEQIYAATGLDKATASKVLAKLRADKKVKTQGAARAMTYSL